MYSALELHKEILEGLQTVDAFSQDMFLPEEYDFHLNKMQDSFITELLDKGFADRQLRLDYIQNLIVKNKRLPVFISPTAFYYESGAVTSYLPGNYKHLLATRAIVRKTLDCAKLVENLEDHTQVFQYIKLDTKSIKSPYYHKVRLVRMDTEETTIAEVSLPVEEKEDIYLIVKNLLYQANKHVDKVNFYWEKHTNGQQQGVIDLGHFIIEDDSFINPDDTSGYKIEIYDKDGVLETPNYSTGTLFSHVELWNPKDLKELSPAEETSSALLDNKELYERKQNVFFFPNPLEPHANLADGLIFTYYGNSFLVEEVIIDYIREPQPISIFLTQGCELSESAARIIANRTIEYLKLAIENPTYRDTLQHNEIRDQK